MADSDYKAKIFGALSSAKKKAGEVIEDVKDGAAVTKDVAKTMFNRATMQKDPPPEDMSPRTKRIFEQKVTK